MLQGTTDPLYATCGIKKQNAKRSKWNQIGSIQQKLLFVHICTLHWFNVIKNAYAKIEIEKKKLAMKYNLHGFHVVARDSVFYGVDHCGGTKAPRVHKIVKNIKLHCNTWGCWNMGT